MNISGWRDAVTDWVILLNLPVIDGNARFGAHKLEQKTLNASIEDLSTLHNRATDLTLTTPQCVLLGDLCARWSEYLLEVKRFFVCYNSSLGPRANCHDDIWRVMATSVATDESISDP